MLTADPQDERAVGRLEDAVIELEAVLDDVPADDGYDDVSAALEDLLSALHSATLNPVDDDLSGRIAERLAVVGTQVQPVCEFPA